MLYELIAVVRPGSLAEVKEIVRTTGSLVLSSGGAIRSMANWGVSALPKRTRKHQSNYSEGHYFIMRYDASSAVQDNVRKTLGLDPRMIKFSSVKLGDGKLESISKYGSKIPWLERESR
ncbi:MAG: hypothetical protein M1818_007301 [Claussenomyces sp. TS43310]|nr:MAG: hypothetical protein M1818_007301 [Claussenomyces sp. TS43310]